MTILLHFRLCARAVLATREDEYCASRNNYLPWLCSRLTSSPQRCGFDVDLRHHRLAAPLQASQPGQSGVVSHQTWRRAAKKREIALPALNNAFAPRASFNIREAFRLQRPCASTVARKDFFSALQKKHCGLRSDPRPFFSWTHPHRNPCTVFTNSPRYRDCGANTSGPATTPKPFPARTRGTMNVMQHPP